MQDLDRIIRVLDSLEQDIRSLKQLVLGGSGGNFHVGGSSMPPRGGAEMYGAPRAAVAHMGDEEAGIEGIFDGEHMVTEDGKAYQVAANYASKSKLVEGDPLKLYITPDGKFFFKQLGPVPRLAVESTITQQGNHYVATDDDGKTYKVLTASVTYYMSVFGLQPGGRVMILLPELPEGEQATWACIDNIL